MLDSFRQVRGSGSGSGDGYCARDTLTQRYWRRKVYGSSVGGMLRAGGDASRSFLDLDSHGKEQEQPAANIQTRQQNRLTSPLFTIKFEPLPIIHIQHIQSPPTWLVNKQGVQCPGARLVLCRSNHDCIGTGDRYAGSRCGSRGGSSEALAQCPDENTTQPASIYGDTQY